MKEMEEKTFQIKKWRQNYNEQMVKLYHKRNSKEQEDRIF